MKGIVRRSNARNSGWSKLNQISSLDVGDGESFESYISLYWARGNGKSFL